jgi:hypothetical protein
MNIICHYPTAADQFQLAAIHVVSYYKGSFTPPRTVATITAPRTVTIITAALSSITAINSGAAKAFPSNCQKA